ncbi:penicillin-binding protein, 1A family, nonfunctional [Candidatus Saccharibacteria bacterium RAAC3_TM7_1]|nr:penicillin-binding protein, 1A family, nonfunctional [Candidatus Saccharibacteria bacterium RAAC3_TM7_1]HCZ28781.1 PBP1A family penicillin-binding protein [Candidatus Saccharibacteria bacterium]
MYRQGKYTKKVGPLAASKQFLDRRWKWFKKLSRPKKALVIGAPILAFLIITPLVTYISYYNDIGNTERLMNRNNTGIVLEDRNGKAFFSSGRAVHRTLVPLDKISDNLEHALIASEDKDFYRHEGFSVAGIFRSLFKNVSSGKIAGGGSTLTQQLAKNTLLTEQQTILRKYQELTISIAIEQRYSKDEILDMYLNSVFFGGTAFGIDEAADFYFGKEPSQLSLAESAMLVGILPAPNAYSPTLGNPTYARERQTTVLNRMVAEGYITQAEKQKALAETLHYQKPDEQDKGVAPHFAEMVLKELYDKYGQEKVLRSGYQVKTTLDLGMQKAANQAVSDGMAHIQAYGGSNASVVAIDPKTGEVRALVGSADYDNTKFGKVNMATTPRQPGSSFKPIYYSDALENGTVTPVTVLDDKATDFGGGYRPQNADRTFHGKVTVRQALDWSLNIPAIKVMQKEGVANAVEAAKDLGITTLKDSGDYGLSLALGSAEVPLMEMTNAYAAFANQGQQYDHHIIKSIQDKYSKVIFASDRTSHKAISVQGAYLISNILSDNTTRARIFGNSLTVYGTDGQIKTAAVKTGTTDDSKDAWTIGYTPEISVGVWVGNNDNTAMYSGGSDMAGPIWRQLMRYSIGNKNPSFVQPSGITKATVCTDIGVLTDVFLSSNVPKECEKKKPVENEKKDPTKTNKQNTEKCTVTGKENLDASDPDCKVDMCPYDGLGDIAQNDPNCIDPATADDDGDGVMNDTDQCPNTPEGTLVDDKGCLVVNQPNTSSP